MSLLSMLFLAVIFLVFAGGAAAAAYFFTPNRFRRRVASMESEPRASLGSDEANPWVERVVKVTRPLAKLSRPKEGWEDSPIRIRFMNAGWRQASAPYVFYGAKTILALLLPLLALLFGGAAFRSGSQSLMFVIVACSYAGYYAPNLLLKNRINNRQREIFESFPDALDLLTICVEAGLGLDAAIAKVAAEIQLKSKVLAEELQMVQLELRTGFTKEHALRNFALRSGVEDIDLLVAMLIQSDRFGTSMGDSLRIHSENLRIKRRQRAEEAAAKVALKLLFPLIFFIFPTLMVILIGPAMLTIYRNLLPALAGSS